MSKLTICIYNVSVKLRTWFGNVSFVDVHLEHFQNIELRTSQNWELKASQIMCIVNEKQHTLLNKELRNSEVREREIYIYIYINHECAKFSHDTRIVYNQNKSHNSAESACEHVT